MAQRSRANQSQWRLLRYARFTRSTEANNPTEKDRQSTSNQAGTWKHFAWSDSEPLLLSVQDSSRLLITRGKLILENHPLFDAEHYIKGAFKGDSILFMQKMKNECRKFRIKLMQGAFPSTLEACADCVAKLRTFFQVRDEGVDPSQRQPTEDRATLQGKVSLGSIAKVVLGSETLDLPLAYDRYRTAGKPCQLAEATRLCLTDPEFPAFVQSVEEELQRIMAEG